MESKIFRLKRIRAQIKRFLPLLFLFFAILIMVLVHSDAMIKTRSVLWDFVSPVVSLVRQPVYWVKNGAESIQNWVSTYHKNEVLMKENEDLKQWRLLALKLETENNELKKHLNYQPPKKSKEILAEIAMDEGGAFSRSFIVSAGKNQGVVKGMLGFGPQALFARIVEVGENYSRLMPLTDYMSRVPVYVGQEKKYAFLMGDNTDTPYLQILNENDEANQGDIVLSSGYMGVYPANLPIGKVCQEDKDAPRICLFENINTLTFVRLIDFGLTENLIKQDGVSP